ncbi:MAG: hypothetical protein NT120_04150 [Candidatus Aenigmarchaeota archaeon]|nr:hypothetical protein [Candidatus Aenigmarchaeota archaeon]
MIEIIGMAIILALWIIEMSRNLAKNIDSQREKFLIVYIIGFFILASYSTGIDMKFAFFFLLLGLVSVLEFAFIMVKKYK